MSVRYLSDEHFSNAGGRVLRCNLPGIVFVMFKTQNCQHCAQTIPLFNQLAQRDMRLTWAVIDVGDYRNIITMSKSSNTPIRAVPMFILYVNGRPHANYKGQRAAKPIMLFLDKLLNSLNMNEQSFTPPIQQDPHPQAQYKPQIDPQQHQMPTDNLNLPKNVIPYNAPYMAYRSMGMTSKQG